MFNVGDKIRITRNVGLYSDGRPICGTTATINLVGGAFVTCVTDKENIVLNLKVGEYVGPDDFWWGQNEDRRDFVKDYIETEKNLEGYCMWKIGPDGWGSRI